MEKPFNGLEKHVHGHGIYFGCGIFGLFLMNITDDGTARKTKLLGEGALSDTLLSRNVLDCFALSSLGPAFERFVFILLIWDYFIFICQ